VGQSFKSFVVKLHFGVSKKGLPLAHGQYNPVCIVQGLVQGNNLLMSALHHKGMDLQNFQLIQKRSRNILVVHLKGMPREGP